MNMMRIASSREITLQGFPFVVTDLICDTAKLQVKETCPMTDEGRRSMNKWLLDNFGVNQNLLFDGKTFYVPEKYYMQLMQLSRLSAAINTTI